MLLDEPNMVKPTPFGSLEVVEVSRCGTLFEHLGPPHVHASCTSRPPDADDRADAVVGETSSSEQVSSAAGGSINDRGSPGPVHLALFRCVARSP